LTLLDTVDRQVKVLSLAANNSTQYPGRR